MTTTIAGHTRESFQVGMHYAAAHESAAKLLPQILPRAAQYLADRAKAGGLSQPYNPYRLLELHYLLERDLPKTIVELGCGATTLVLAAYADRHDAQVITLEEDLNYAGELNNYLGENDGTRVSVYKADRLVEWRDGFETCRYNFDYRTLPAAIDLLYVDGPNNGTLAGPLPGTDAADIAACRQVTSLLFDIRRSSVEWFADHTPGYAIETGYGITRGEQPWFLHGLRHHTLARKM